MPSKGLKTGHDLEQWEGKMSYKNLKSFALAAAVAYPLTLASCIPPVRADIFSHMQESQQRFNDQQYEMRRQQEYRRGYEGPSAPPMQAPYEPPPWNDDDE